VKPCPNCGYRHADVDYASELDGIKISPRRRDVILRLQQAKGAYVSVSAMFDFLYGADPNGGPVSNALLSHIAMVRTKIEPLGWTIENDRARGYRLVRVKA
jgi:hypothetical protein